MEAASPAVGLQESHLQTPRIAASPWVVLIVLALGEFLILLDATIVAVAMPSLSKDLSASFDQLLWVLNAYTLGFAVLLITSGRFGDIFGPKKLFLAGIATFTLASAACSLAQDPNQLIAFRIVQAVGGALLIPQTLSIITSIFPPEKRGAAFGAWSAIAGLAAVAGPTLGGVLTSAFSWRAVFIPNIPIGIAALVLAVLLMPEMTVHRRRNMDLVGTALVTFGLFGLVFCLIELQRYQGDPIFKVATFSFGSIHSGVFSIPIILIFSIVLLVVFVRWEAAQDEPLLPLSLFRDVNFSIGNIVAAAVNFGILGFFLPLTIFLQSVLGFSAVESGIVILPNALATMITAPISGVLTDKLNGKYLLFIGLTLFSAGLILLAVLTKLGAGGWVFFPPLFVAGLGMGFTFAPMTALAMRNIIPSAAGAASGFLNTIRQVGAAMGSAVVGATLAIRLASQAHDHAVTAVAGKASLKGFRSQFVAEVDRFAKSGLKVGANQTHVAIPSTLPTNLRVPWTTLGTAVFNQAFVDAMKVAVLVPIPLLAIAAGLTFLMRTRRLVPAGVQVVGAPDLVAIPAAQRSMRVAAPLYVSDSIVMPSLQPIARPGATAVLPRLRPPFLVQTGGDRKEYPLRRALSVGRLRSNDIALEDEMVSRSHAVISIDEGTASVRDLNSGNGTFVNSRRVAGEHLLHSGDIVMFGETSFVFHNDFEAARPRLVMQTGGRQVEYMVTKSLSLGRVPSNDIVIVDDKASRRHAQVWVQKGQVFIRDLESLNGTTINGDLVVGDQPIYEGDVVSIGSVSLVFHNDTAAIPA